MCFFFSQDVDKDNSSAIHLAAEKGYHKLVLVFVKEFGGKLDNRAKQAMLTVTEQPLPSDVPPPSSMSLHLLHFSLPPPPPLVFGRRVNDGSRCTSECK